MLELIPASKHATSDEYFGQYCIRFILGIGKVFFRSTMKTKEEKKKMSLATVCDLPSLTLSDSEARHLHQFKKIANYQHVSSHTGPL